MRRKTAIMSALILVFALMFAACAARRPLQTQLQPGPGTGINNNFRGVGTGTDTGTGTRFGTGAGTGTRFGTRTGMDSGFNNRGFGFYGTGNNFGGGNFGESDFSLGRTNSSTGYADRLARECETITGVNNATVVLSGNTAYVGVNSGGNNTGRNISFGAAGDTTGIKRQCAQRIKAANPQINTVYVSSDADFFNRLRKVGNGIRNGTPAESFRNELSGLIRNLTPERL